MASESKRREEELTLKEQVRRLNSGRNESFGQQYKPYELALTRKGRIKVDKTADKLSKLDSRRYIWVRKTNDEEDLETGIRTQYYIGVTAETEIDDIRDMIAKKERVHGYTTLAEDTAGTDAEVAAAVQKRVEEESVFVYCGQVLESGKKLKDYPVVQESFRWSKPYAGVIWLCPAHLKPGFARSKKWA